MAFERRQRGAVRHKRRGRRKHGSRGGPLRRWRPRSCLRLRQQRRLVAADGEAHRLRRRRRRLPRRRAWTCDRRRHDRRRGLRRRRQQGLRVYVRGHRRPAADRDGEADRVGRRARRFLRRQRGDRRRHDRGRSFRAREPPRRRLHVRQHRRSGSHRDGEADGRRGAGGASRPRPRGGDRGRHDRRRGSVRG